MIYPVSSPGLNVRNQAIAVGWKNLKKRAKLDVGLWICLKYLKCLEKTEKNPNGGDINDDLPC